MSSSESIEVPVVQAQEPVTPTPPIAVSDRMQDSAAELEKIRQELEAQATPTPTIEQIQVPPTEPAQPATTPAAVTPEQVQSKPAVAVPDKFKTPDGKLDAERVLKSALEAEKELKRLQNQRHQWQQAAPVAQPAPQAQVQAPVAPAPNQDMTPFEQQLEADVQKYGAGRVLARLFDSARQAAVEEMRTPVQSLLETSERNAMEAELRSLMSADPELFTKSGVETLMQIRSQNPNASWTEAYQLHLGRVAYQQKVGQSGQVQTPTPTAPTAPIAPVGAAPIVPASVTPNTRTMTESELKDHLSKLTPEQEDQFWKLQGFKPFNVNPVKRVPVRNP